MTRALVLADDATGALECGSLLAGMGVEVKVSLGGEAPVGEAVVVNTDTRHVAAEEAARVVREWVRKYAGAAIYKKTDSLLRGNIGAELAAAGVRFYLPAYPALGRTVKEGVLSVNGVPVHLSAAGRDPRHAVKSSRVADVLGGAEIAVLDAETTAENEAWVEKIAREQERMPPLAGPAGLVRVWARELGLERRAAGGWPEMGKAVVVCGSHHPVSREQARRAVGRVTVLATPEERGEDAVGPAERLVAEAVEYGRRRGVKTWIVFGGETLLALWRALGVETIEPLPEVLPGVGAARGGGYLFVTKAGSFGPPDVVNQMMEVLA